MNITLIGMPGVGKSILGQKLAKRLHYKFIDTDKIIEKKTGMKLQQIIDNWEEEGFLKIEQRVILELNKFKNRVISPGGSVVYSPKAIRFLKKNSLVVFLNASFANIKKRLKNQSTRGIVGMKNKNLETLFKERQILYKKYADVTVPITENFNMDLAVKNIIREMQHFSSLFL